MIFISHARGKHAPRKSVLDETMKAGFALLDEWTASDLVNNMWQFIFLGKCACWSRLSSHKDPIKIDIEPL